MGVTVRYSVLAVCDQPGDRRGCRQSIDYTTTADIGPARLRKTAVGFFAAQGGSVTGGKTFCPECLRRPLAEPAPPVAHAQDPEEYAARFHRFMQIAATPAELARRLNKLCRGVNWTHSSKKSMAAAYASRNHFGSPQACGPQITEEMVDLLLKDYGTK